jgi:hypothetical protein
MKHAILPLAASFALGCAGTAETRTPTANIPPECKPHKGRFDAMPPGVTELRGTVEVPLALEGQTLYVALDYSTKEGRRKSIPVGKLESIDRTMRFFCRVGSPADVAFWKWVLIAPPAESCGYYGEATGEVETAVNVTCEASRVMVWDAYKDLFGAP